MNLIGCLPEVTFEVFDHHFIDADGLVSETGKEFREKMHGKRLMDGSHMRGASQLGALRGDPMRASGVRMNELDLIFSYVCRYFPGVNEAARNCFLVNGH